ncbi:MAG TPA: right-handed parallel beta-helix repeat-containing protein [Bacteroidota bacterium]|nr:right-handed parallel beta-helix repeat-containing protein [Bacteroidota bacterium]
MRHFAIEVSILLIVGTLLSYSQPSGGPYGPMLQHYQLPTGAGRIYYVAVDGKPEQPGSSLDAPTTLESAIEKVQTGDAIVMRGGVYRTGNLMLNQGITIQPYADEQPVLKGTYVAKDWKNLGNGLWKTTWTHLFPAKPDSWWSRDRFGKETPLCIFNNDMVFVDGKFLKAVGREGEVDENSYYIDYDSQQVYIGTDPSHKLVEITAFDVAMKRVMGELHGKQSDHKGPTIRGIVFTQYAYRALEVEGKEPEAVSSEAEHGKDVVGTTLEDCTLTFCSRVAAYLRGDHLTMRRCKVSDTSTEGIYIIGSSDVLLEKNIFSRNNIEQITGYYPAAVKIFNQSYRVTCEDNLVIDLPYSNGIWYDVGEVDGRFLNNWVEGVGSTSRTFNEKAPYPSMNGFFFEISKGAVCAGNVFVNCDQGVFILNSANVQVYNNTFVNSTACISRNARNPANDRMFGWHSSTGPDVDKREGHVFMNNLLTGDERFKRPLLFVWQPDSICKQLPNPMLKQIDHNVYIRAAESSSPLILWSPMPSGDCGTGFASADEMRTKLPQFSAHDISKLGYGGPLFKSSLLGNYQLLASAPGAKAGALLPSEIRKLMGLSQPEGQYVGAYAPTK